MIALLAAGCAGAWTWRERALLEAAVLPTAFDARSADDPLLQLGLAAYCDPGLSSPQGTSCATCHDLGLGGADPRGEPTSLGAIAPTGRNAPSIALAGFRDRWSWDGRFTSLVDQVAFPMFGTAYGDRTGSAQGQAVYQALAERYALPYQAAFGAPVDARSDRVCTGAVSAPGAVVDLLGALAVVVEQAVAEPSWLDYAFSGLEVPAELDDPDARAGAKVFVGKGCPDCHSGPYFSDGRLHDIGVASDDAGDGTGRFLTPTLRGVGATAPYMHDGSMADLTEVVWHYSGGGGPSRFGEVDAVITPLDLSDEEVRSLTAFLASLRGLPPLDGDGQRPDGDWWETPPPPLSCGQTL